MAERRPLIAANWKMNKTTGEATEFCAEFLPWLAEDASAGVDVTICPPFTSLALVVAECEGSRAAVAAQNMHFESSGAFTGEVSAPMLADLGVTSVVLGHSERRQFFGEHDHALAKKVKAAIGAGLVPILCVGESEAEREAGATENILRRQVEGDLDKIPDDRLGDVVIAYEPVWAIGTGKTASAEQANDACAFIRSLVANRSEEAAAAVRIQYGGSVKPGNAEELLGQPDIDGALVGGAALEPGDFAAIVAAAR